MKFDVRVMDLSLSQSLAAHSVVKRHTDQDLVGDGRVDLDNLYPALVECFGIIILGYVAGRLNFISDIESKGLNTFVGTFSLPALIFLSLCKLDLSSVNWTFLLAIFISKAVVFFVVLLVTLFVTRPTDPAKAGLFAIFTTQSNDFALGYPILQALYGHTHPDYPMYLYLLAPISLVILNPIGFISMEISKARNDAVQQSKWHMIAKMIRGVITNPVIFMTILGVIGNFIFGHAMPNILGNFLQTLGNAFSASALFLLGLRMVGKGSSMSGQALVGSFVLIAVKIVALPLVAREVVSQFHAGQDANETVHLSNFAFLYGTFPTAPSVFVFASQYNVAMDVTAGAMVACTFIAAPIMFVSARLLSVTSVEPNKYIEELDSFLLDISIVGLVATIWVAFIFFVTNRYRLIPHSFTLNLVISQAIACIGAILWSEMTYEGQWEFYLQFSIFAFGVYATGINTAVLSINVMLMKRAGSSFVAKLRLFFNILSFVLPLILVGIMLLFIKKADSATKLDPNFQYGTAQAYVALTVLVVSFSVTVVCLILAQRTTSPLASSETTRLIGDDQQRLLDSTSTDEDRESPVPIEDLVTIGTGATGTDETEGNRCSQRQCCEPNKRGAGRYRCDSEHIQYCSYLMDRYAVPPASDAIIEMDQAGDEHQLFRHTLFLLMLAASMFIGIALCIWTLVMDEMSGLYLELVFLDGFFNFGQGLFAFAIFGGTESRYIGIPIKRFYRKLMYGQDSLVLPNWEDLDSETKHHCQQFIKHHISKCMESIVKDIRYRLTTYRAVFRGSDLVDWLLEVELARSRQDAVHYGRYLIKGRIIRHVENHLDFYDDSFIYTFEPQ